MSFGRQAACKGEGLDLGTSDLWEVLKVFEKMLGLKKGQE